MFDTKTEDSFYKFIKNKRLAINKIKNDNSPDFLVDDNFIFEIKAINESGTLQKINGMDVQNINIKNVINKYIIDAHKKIRNYRKTNKNVKYFALVIYDLRYHTWDHFLEALLACKIRNYKNIDSLIYAGYNKPKNLTLALHIFMNSDKKINKIFSKLSYKEYRELSIN